MVQNRNIKQSQGIGLIIVGGKEVKKRGAWCRLEHLALPQALAQVVVLLKKSSTDNKKKTDSSSSSNKSAKASTKAEEPNDRLHSTDIAFKPNKSGWGYTKDYSSNFDDIFKKKGGNGK